MRSGEIVDGRFEIERLAGRGGMGAVYRARDLESGGHAAIKVLLDFDVDPDAIARFAREASLLAELSHPNLVRYLAHGSTSDGRRFIAMEWLEGETFEERLERQGTSIQDSVSVVRQAAEAIGVAHARGVVHRDLKPRNIMLVDGDPARVRLVDFGVARVADDSKLTVTGSVIGTPFYMSPEQARGERAIDARADVFALGCVLYRCLVGAVPFDGTSGPSILLRIVFEEPPGILEARPDVPPALADLVTAMLAKSPDDRPADGRAVAKALAALGPLAASEDGPRSLSPAALTVRERKIASLVLARASVTGSSTARGTALMPHADASLRDAIDRHGGVLSALADGTLVVAMASGIVATDQAERLARCALAVRRLAGWEAVAISFGSHELAARAAVGEVLDAALGLLDVPSDHVRVDPRLVSLLETRFEVADDGRGFVLRGERDTASERGSTLLGRRVPCFGREPEIAMLEAMLAQCIDDPGARAAVVIALAGVGKSRLGRELVARAAVRDDAPAIWIARGDPLRAGSPFGMLSPLVRAQANIAEREPAAACESKLRDRVSRHVPAEAVSRVTEFLAALASIPLVSTPSAALAAARDNAMLLADQIRSAWTAFIRAEASSQPLVIVLEDLHWGDLPTVKAIDAALGELAHLPIFVVALARPEVTDVFPRLWAERSLQTITLRELGKRASERLVRAALGAAATDDVVARVVDRAAGNAFFLEELVRAEAASGGGALPETVLATLTARLESLDVEARRVLRAASVFGEAFWRGGVLSLLGAGGATPSPSRAASLAECLRALEQAEFLIQKPSSRFPGDVEFAFRHALVRDAAYAMLTDGDRALGHRLAGSWLEGSGESDLRALARHFELGSEMPRAAVLYRRAAERALAGDDVATSIACARQAITCGAEGTLRGEARLVEVEALRFTQEPEAAFAAVDEAIALLPVGSASYFRAVGEKILANYHAGRPLEPDEVMRLAIAPALAGAASARAVALVRASTIFQYTGRVELGDRMLDEARAVDEASLDLVARAQIARAAGVRARSRRDIEATLAYFEVARELLERIGDRRSGGIVLSDLALAETLAGNLERATALAREGRDLARGAGLTAIVAITSSTLGCALAAQGDRAGAKAAFEESIALFIGPVHAPLLAGQAKTHHAFNLLALGEIEQAEREARGAIELVEQGPTAMPAARAALVRVLLARGALDEAAVEARRAQRVLREVSDPDSPMMVKLVIAEALFATGHVDEAREALRIARDQIRGEADRITDPARKESFLTRVPEHARTLALADAWLASR